MLVTGNEEEKKEKKLEEECRGEVAEGRSVIIAATLDGIRFLAANSSSWSMKKILRQNENFGLNPDGILQFQNPDIS